MKFIDYVLNRNANEEIQEKPTETYESTIQSFSPTSIDEATSLIDKIRLGRPIIIKLNNLQAEYSQRILDLLSGACYAFGLSVCTLEENAYLFGVRK